ncbi:MAG: hypothetical protein KDE22_10825, partial [Rhodobacterales bacterium]|nr:hypothetical protein [Rhodobacterales bacterium]
IEHYTDVPVLGSVHKDPALAIDERHLGLIPSNEAARARETVAALGASVAAQVDLDAVMAVARTAPRLEAPGLPRATAPGADLRIGIARDSAFGFYYAGDLEALEDAGATLVPIDTAHDARLPDLDGLFIGGGFPETHMTALEANVPLRAAIKDAIEGGLPAYAECGGLMYLSRSLTWGGVTCEMVGVIPGDTVMHDSPQGRGYVRLRETGRAPWPATGGAVPDTLPAHEFHYSSLENLAPDTVFAYDVLRGHGTDGRHDGIVIHNLLASYAHLRDVEAHHWARRFVAFIRDRGIRARETRGAAPQPPARLGAAR